MKKYKFCFFTCTLETVESIVEETGGRGDAFARQEGRFASAAAAGTGRLLAELFIDRTDESSTSSSAGFAGGSFLVLGRRS